LIYLLVEVVRILLAKGASVNDPGGSHCQGVTPLHDAAQNGHIEIVKLLVENGASLLNKDVRVNNMYLVLFSV
jgi:NF-kappa-B inhibitor-like protein 2